MRELTWMPMIVQLRCIAIGIYSCTFISIYSKDFSRFKKGSKT